MHYALRPWITILACVLAMFGAVQVAASAPTTVAVDLSAAPASAQDLADEGFNSLTVSETGIRILETLTKRSDVAIFDFEKLYDVVGTEKSLSKILETPKLKTLEGRLSSESGKHLLRFSLRDANGKRTERDALLESLDDAEPALRLIEELSMAAGIPIQQSRAGRYRGVSLERLLLSAKSTTTRLVGLRYSNPEEERLVSRAEAIARELEAETPSLESALELTAIMFRQYMIGFGVESQLLIDASALLENYRTTGEHRSARFHLRRGVINFWRKTVESEVIKSDLEEAFRLDPTLADAQYSLGFFARLHGEDPEERISQAISHYEEAIKANPAHLKARTDLARRRYRSNKGPYESEFEQILSIRRYPRALYYLSTVQWEKGNEKAAYRLLGELDKDGYYPTDVHRKRALFEYEQRKYDKAERSLVAAIAAFTKDNELETLYVAGLTNNDSAYQELRVRIAKRIEVNRRPSKHDEIMLGLIAAREGDIAVARQFADLLKARYPEGSEWLVWLGVGLIHKHLGEDDYARDFGTWAWKSR